MIKKIKWGSANIQEKGEGKVTSMPIQYAIKAYMGHGRKDPYIFRHSNQVNFSHHSTFPGGNHVRGNIKLLEGDEVTGSARNCTEIMKLLIYDDNLLYLY
jgi:hypothetical protein